MSNEVGQGSSTYFRSSAKADFEQLTEVGQQTAGYRPNRELQQTHPRLEPDYLARSNLLDIRASGLAGYGT